MTLSPEFSSMVSICAGIVTIYGLVKIAKTPFDKVTANAKDIEELKKKSTKQAEIDKAILNGLQAITNHMIDGNGIDRLRASRDELQHAISDIATK
ncbi:MAG: hypothetical protein E7187_04780 [Erysipelotrichaceae bacterium]|nr:hypothetical protein [Erysipelotrichaceae bacterium]